MLTSSSTSKDPPDDLWGVFLLWVKSRPGECGSLPHTTEALVFCCEENEVWSGEMAHLKCDAGALFMAHQEIEVLTSVDDDDGRQKMPSQHLRFISQC